MLIAKGNGVIALVLDRNLTKGGLLVPETAKKEVEYSEVLSVGDGQLQNGAWVKPPFAVGDKILYFRGFPVPEKHESGGKLVWVDVDDIVAVEQEPTEPDAG